MNFERLKESIKGHEGISLFVYTCPAGKQTIGYGRNLEDRGITHSEAERMLVNDLQDIKLILEDDISFFCRLPDNVQEVLIEMAYQLGVNGLMKFSKTISLVANGDYIEASKEMLNSKWAKQTPKRAETLSNKMKGEF